MTIGERITEIRKNAHLSQEAFGESLGVTRQAISKWESDASIPDVDKLILISKTYNISVGWILGIEEKSEDTEFTQSQLELVREIVRQCTEEIEHKLNEGPPPEPPKQPQPVKKRRPKLLIILAIIAVIVFVSWCSNLTEQLRSLKNSQGYLQSQITSVESSVYNQTNVLTEQIEEILNAQNSVLADFGYNIVGYNYTQDTVDIEVYMVPKTYTDGMTAEFEALSDEESFTAQGTESGNHRFKGTITCKMSNCITLTVSITKGEIVETQLIDIIYHIKSETIPTVYFSGASTLWGTNIYSGTDGTQSIREEEIIVSEDKYSVAYSNGIYATDVTVYLIINNKIVESFQCEKREIDRDFHDWYTKFTFGYKLSDGDRIVYAGVITDNYGRQHVFYDIGYIVEGDFIEHDPSKQYVDTDDDIYGLLD